MINKIVRDKQLNRVKTPPIKMTDLKNHNVHDSINTYILENTTRCDSDSENKVVTQSINKNGKPE